MASEHATTTCPRCLGCGMVTPEAERKGQFVEMVKVGAVIRAVYGAASELTPVAMAVVLGAMRADPGALDADVEAAAESFLAAAWDAAIGARLARRRGHQVETTA